MVIREATIEDAEAVAQLHVATWRVVYEGIIHQSYLDSCLDLKDRIQRWMSHINEGHTTVFVTEEERSMIGFVDVGVSREEGMRDQAEIYSLYLVSDRLREGIGTLLFNHAVRQISTWDFNHFYLWTLEENMRGRSFYERMGGVLSSETRDAIIDDVPYKQVQYRWDNINDD